jgi:hypothetical protein
MIGKISMIKMEGGDQLRDAKQAEGEMPVYRRMVRS